MSQPPLADYALLGDCRSGALVSRSGAIDWLCWPAFDAPPLFGALLDPERGGTFTLGPEGPIRRTTRRYVGESAIVETTFEVEGGALRLTDLMPAASETEKRHLTLPDHELLRRLDCTAGSAQVAMRFRPRPDFGRRRARLYQRSAVDVRLEWGDEQVILRASRPLTLAGDEARLTTRLAAGDSLSLSLTYTHDAPAVLPPFGEREAQTIARTLAWWSGWSGALEYDGPYREMIVRSAITLKLLQFAPSGAIVAAPTSSLPERIGGPLNWDYRFCWLRDASLTARALYGLGYFDEADALVSWLLHATRLTRPRLQILYDTWGRPPPVEIKRDRLSGYLCSQPVRFGNAAASQLQLDVYGEVVEAAARFTRTGGCLDRETSSLLCAIGRYVCEHWFQPDEGIWEPRDGRRLHTHSLALSWAALDRLLDLCGCGEVRKAAPPRFAVERERIRAVIESRGWNPELGAYTGVLDSDNLDASLLLLPYHGFLPAASPRMRSTLARIRERLGAGRSLIYRYLENEQPHEGAFAICCFWAVECMALGAASLDEARAAFEELCGFASDLGLFGEEIDPTTGEALGNFPQAFTHVGLISAALALEERAARDRAHVPPGAYQSWPTTTTSQPAESSTPSPALLDRARSI